MKMASHMCVCSCSVSNRKIGREDHSEDQKVLGWFQSDHTRSDEAIIEKAAAVSPRVINPVFQSEKRAGRSIRDAVLDRAGERLDPLLRSRPAPAAIGGEFWPNRRAPSFVDGPVHGELGRSPPRALIATTSDSLARELILKRGCEAIALPFRDRVGKDPPEFESSVRLV